jgi:hypothetical protein
MAVLVFATSCKTSGNNGTLVQNAPFNGGNYIENEYFSIVLPGNYYLNTNQGPDGAIYYIESKTEETVERHGEIFRGFHPGTAELYYAHDSKIETVFIEILNRTIELGIYFEKDLYSTIAIIPIKNNDGFETYLRIIGIEKTRGELQELINSFSTLTMSRETGPMGASYGAVPAYLHFPSLFDKNLPKYH